jgi:glutathione peroxidase-family protein
MAEKTKREIEFEERAKKAGAEIKAVCDKYEVGFTCTFKYEETGISAKPVLADNKKND